MQKVEDVTAPEVMEMANELFDGEKVAVTLLGRLDGLKLNRSHLVC